MAPKTLSPGQRQAAALVAIGSTDTEIAATVGVAKSTVMTWRRREDFQREVNDCVSQTQRLILRRGVADAAAAQGYLRSVVDSDDPKISPTQKIQAAGKLLDRMPAIRPELLTDPVPEPAALPSASTPALPPATVLEIVKVMREIESARKHGPVGPLSYDEDDLDDEDEDDDRVIQGEIVRNEPAPAPASRKAAPTKNTDADARQILADRGGLRGARPYMGGG